MTRGALLFLAKALRLAVFTILSSLLKVINSLNELLPVGLVVLFWVLLAYFAIDRTKWCIDFNVIIFRSFWWNWVRKFHKLIHVTLAKNYLEHNMNRSKTYSVGTYGLSSLKIIRIWESVFNYNKQTNSLPWIKRQLYPELFYTDSEPNASIDLGFRYM